MLLLDEPTAALDAESTARIGATLRGLAARGLGVCVATHDLEFAAAWSRPGGAAGMSETLLRVLAGVGFAALAAWLAFRLRLGLSREILVAAARAVVQLAAVGAAIALVFEVEALAFVFVAVMAATAGLTAGQRLAGLPDARVRALAAIALPALAATAVLLAVGAFDATPRAAVPTAGILIGGAMAATTLAGRQLLAALADETGEIEARLCLGDDARDGARPRGAAGAAHRPDPGDRPDAQRRPRHAARARSWGWSSAGPPPRRPPPRSSSCCSRCSPSSSPPPPCSPSSRSAR